ncbi:transporter substrate-binding domain-containing protein [bacterium]|nr:transporter substrate-binding domain-containing protein [bacterium]
MKTSLAAEKVVTVAMDDSYAPYAYRKNGKAMGPYVDITKEIFKRAKIPYKIRSYPWVRTLKGAMAGKYMASGLYYTEERAETLDYTNAYYIEQIVVYSHKDKKFDYSGIESLTGKTIGVRRGFSYGHIFDTARKARKFSVIELEEEKTAFKMLLAKRVDAVVAEKYVGSEILKENGQGGMLFRYKRALANNPIHMVVPKTPAYKGLLEKLNNVITPEFVEKAPYE